MINLLFIVCIGVIVYILKLVMNKIKEKQEKELKERVNKLTQLQYYTYRYYSNSGKDIIMRELVLDNIEYWEELYVNKLYLTMKRIQNPNKQLLAYVTGYINPILVDITNMDKKYYLDNIIYYTVTYIDSLIDE